MPEVDDDDDIDDDDDYDGHNDDNLLVGKWPNVYKPCLNSRQWRTSSSFKPPASAKGASEIQLQIFHIETRIGQNLSVLESRLI